MASTQTGTISSLRLCKGHREPMEQVDAAEVVAGYGIEGDRHATRKTARAGRQMLLMAEETIAAFGLEPGQVRENITTSGVDVDSLGPGDRVALGNDAVVEITGHCEPCERMDEIRQGLRQDLGRRRGMLAMVIQGGTVRAGDSVRVTAGAATR